MADQSSNKDQIVEFGGFEVVYVSGERGQPIPEQAPAAFDALEARLPTLRKKRFYGAVIDGAYRACVAVDKDTSTLDLPRLGDSFGPLCRGEDRRLGAAPRRDRSNRGRAPLPFRF